MIRLFYKRIFFLLLWFSLEGSFCAMAQATENPLAYRPLAKSIEEGLVGEHQNFLVKAILLPLSFYAEILSRVDGDRCPSQPSCSLYARQAIDRHGAVLGFWMTVDRLIHERTEIVRGARQGRVVRLKDGRARVLDTLEANDFWLHDP